MKTADLYIRVSTDEQAEKGYSQRAQEEMLRKYCTLNNVSIRKVIFEDHSAKSFERPEWGKYLQFIKKTKGQSDLVLFLKWDRFSRNAGDAYRMINLLRQYGIEPQAIEQPLDLSIPENKMMLAFYLAAPEVENDRRALNTFHGMRRARKEGRYMGMAPFGYANKTDEDGKKYIVVNTREAVIVKWAFEEVAKKVYNINQVYILAKEKGFLRAKSNFWSMLRNPIYIGKIFLPKYKDEEARLVNAQHDAIISETLFNEVGDLLDGRKTPRINLKVFSTAELPLRGFIVCPHCGRMLTGSASKGRSRYYFYYHCMLGCKFRIRADDVNNQFERQLNTYIPRPEMLPLYRKVLIDNWNKQSTDLTQERQKSQKEIENLKKKLAYARDLLMEQKIEADDYRDLKNQYTTDLQRLEAKISIEKEHSSDINQLIGKGLDSLMSVRNMYASAEMDVKRKIIGSIFPEKMSFENKSLRTGRLNEFVKCIYMIDSKLPKNKTGQNENNFALSCLVTPSGFKPETPTSVVWYSIQLSYGAIPYWGCKYR